MQFNLSLIAFYLVSVAAATVIPIDNGYGYGYGNGAPAVSSATDVTVHSSAAHGGVQSTGATQPVPHPTTAVTTVIDGDGTVVTKTVTISLKPTQAPSKPPVPVSSGSHGGTTLVTTAITAGDGSVVTRTVTVTQKPTQAPHKPTTTKAPPKPVTKTVTQKTTVTPKPPKPPVKKPTWKNLGCYTDSANRLLKSSAGMSRKGMTSEMCLKNCQAKGYHYAATEYGQECYCGNSLNSAGGANHLTKAAECNMPCDGNHQEHCGGFWRAHTYHLQ